MQSLDNRTGGRGAYGFMYGFRILRRTFWLAHSTRLRWISLRHRHQQDDLRCSQTRIRVTAIIMVRFHSYSLCVSPFPILLRIRSRIAQVLDPPVSGQLFGGAIHVAGYIMKSTRLRPLKSCSQDLVESSLNLSPQIVEFVLKRNPSLFVCIQETVVDRNSIPVTRYTSRRYRLFCLHAKGSCTLPSVITTIASGEKCVTAVGRGCVEASKFVNLYSEKYI